MKDSKTELYCNWIIIVVGRRWGLFVVFLLFDQDLLGDFNLNLMHDE